jgi:adenylate cyclase
VTTTDQRLAALAELGQRIGAATGVEEVVDLALAGSDELLGLRHSLLLLHQVESDRLVTLASHGYDELGIGSEVRLGEGVIGMAAERRRSMRIGNLQRMLAYALATRPATADRAGTDIRLPGLRLARSQLAAPMCARGTLVGVIAAESERALAFDEADEQALTVVAHLVAAALEREQAGAGRRTCARPGRPTCRCHATAGGGRHRGCAGTGRTPGA